MTENRLDIDLDFSYTDESGAVTNGRATAAGTEVTVSVDRLAPLAGAGLPPLEYRCQFARILVAESDRCMDGLMQGAMLDRLLPVAVQDGGGEAVLRFVILVHRCADSQKRVAPRGRRQRPRA